MVRAPVHQPGQRSAAAGLLRERAVLALFPLSTGAAVVVTILFVPDSLLWPALVLVAGTGLTAAILIWRIRPQARRVLGRRARVGLVAGVVATLAYDAVRWLLVVATPWTVDPFGAFPIFGSC